MSKLVTIFVLTYNRPDFLAECLQSIRSQTFRDFRLIVQDNASNRDNFPVIEQFRDLGLEYVRHSQNLGSGGNFNIAWSRADESKYFMIFHDDDLMHPKLIEEEVTLLESDEQLTWVGCKSKPFKGKAPGFGIVSSVTVQIFDCVGIAKSIIRDNSPCFSSILYRANLAPTIDLEYFASRYSIIGDRPLLLKLVEGRNCALINESLVLYRSHPSQDSKTGPLNEDNIIEAFLANRMALQNDWSVATQRSFFAWTGFYLPYDYCRLSPANRSSFAIFVRKAMDRDVLRLPFLIIGYPLGLAKFQISRAQRIPAKIAKWFRNRNE